MPAAERQQEGMGCGTGNSPGWPVYNWPDNGPGARARKGADVGRWAFDAKRAEMPVLMGKLDTSVSGPEGLPLFDGDAWERVDWRRHEEQVRRRRGRIFKAGRGGGWPTARSLQKLMLRSWSNTLVSVRQATQRQPGPPAAGIYGPVALPQPRPARTGVLR